MNKMQCEVCGSTNLKKIDKKTFECQECGVQYDSSEIELIEEVVATPNTEISKPKIAANLDALSDKLDQLLEQENDASTSVEDLPSKTDEEIPIEFDEKNDLDETDAVNDYSNKSGSPTITNNESEAFDAKTDGETCTHPINAVDSNASSKSSKHKKIIVPSAIGLLILIVILSVLFAQEKESNYDADVDFIPNESTTTISDEAINNTMTSTTSNYTPSEMTSNTTSTTSNTTSTTSNATSTTSNATSTTSNTTSTTSNAASTASNATSTTTNTTSTTSNTTSTTSNTTSTTSKVTTTSSQSAENEENHIHEYSDATCTKQPTCSCGDTLPWVAEHDWEDPTCEKPLTCRVCGTTEGEAWGHNWEEATCETPKKCETCGKVEGKALGHDYENDNVLVCRKCGSFSPNAESVIKGATIERSVLEDTRATINSAKISSIKYYGGDSYTISLVVSGNLNFTGMWIEVNAYSNSGDLIDSSGTHTSSYGSGEYYVSIEVPISCAPSKYVIQI